MIAIINLGTVEIEGVIETQKGPNDKVTRTTFKVPAGKAAQIALGDNLKGWTSVKVTVVTPKNQLYKQVDWVDKEVKWTQGGMQKTGTVPVLPVYSKDP